MAFVVNSATAAVQRVRENSTVKSAEEKLVQARNAVKSTVDARITNPITTRVNKILTTAQGYKDAGLEYVTSARQAAATAFLRIKERGVKAWALETATATRHVLDSSTAATRVALKNKAEVARKAAAKTAQRTRAKSVELAEATGKVVKTKSFQATAASATGGAAMFGFGGGATGLVAGGAAGALAGVPLAFFTFGLSIPVGAFLGGGTGLAVGAAAGAGVGAVGGGAAGYGAYTKSDEIKGAAKYVATKAGDGAELAKTTAKKSTTYVSTKAGESTEFVKAKAKGVAAAARKRVGSSD